MLTGSYSKTGPVPTAPRRRSNGARPTFRDSGRRTFSPPLDFAIWGIMEQKACATKHKSIESLKRALKKAWDEITLQLFACILKNFQKRLDACIKAQDAHFGCS
ncbi:hypothetical protein L596_020095 [Steinernema carpocapsae]|uniref:Uncharacterized protein n=1 Tax=Steinernema carpocapsae TaxID=34508 RepID=A0A4U5MTB8_STECR|nr:hypothetical protein L596_020095 [Steinernema carpocapsae]